MQMNHMCKGRYSLPARAFNLIIFFFVFTKDNSAKHVHLLFANFRMIFEILFFFKYVFEIS